MGIFCFNALRVTFRICLQKEGAESQKIIPDKEAWEEKLESMLLISECISEHFNILSKPSPHVWRFKFTMSVQ